MTDSPGRYWCRVYADERSETVYCNKEPITEIRGHPLCRFHLWTWLVFDYRVTG